MNKKEFKELGNTEKEVKLITIETLKNKSNRTLLYGYTRDGYKWHIYIKNNKIKGVVYNYKGFIELTMSRVCKNSVYIPNERLCPETCDYEFCKLLKEQGIHLPFTAWNPECEKTQYYGKIV